MAALKLLFAIVYMAFGILYFFRNELGTVWEIAFTGLILAIYDFYIRYLQRVPINNTTFPGFMDWMMHFG